METAVKIEETALSLCEQGMGVMVTTPEQYAIAGEVLTQLKSAMKQVEEDIDPLISKAHATHKALTQKKAEVLKPFREADAFVRMKMSGYLQEQERIRQEAQRKAELAAQEAADKERVRLYNAAAKASAKGNEDKANALLEQAEDVYVQPVIIEPTIDKTVQLNGGSVTSKKDIEFTIDNMKELCKAVADGFVPANVMDVQSGKLKNWLKTEGFIGSHYGLRISEIFKPSVRS
jgi:hypothetical protein